MEHIPKEHLQETFENIFSRAARNLCFLRYAKIKNSLPNGENAHCTVEPMEFWVSVVKSITKKEFILT